MEVNKNDIHMPVYGLLGCQLRLFAKTMSRSYCSTFILFNTVCDIHDSFLENLCVTDLILDK